MVTPMTWAAVVVVFLISHLAGDLLLQTEWQALTKVRGLGDPDGRRALLAHVCTYMLAFIPALVWIAGDRSVARAVFAGALIAIPHALVDDGHLVSGWLHWVKHVAKPAAGLSLMVDQSFHVVFLFGAALIAAG